MDGDQRSSTALGPVDKARAWGGCLAFPVLIAYGIYQFFGPGLTTASVYGPVALAIIVFILGPGMVFWRQSQAEQLQTYSSCGFVKGAHPFYSTWWEQGVARMLPGFGSHYPPDTWTGHRAGVPYVVGTYRGEDEDLLQYWFAAFPVANAATEVAASGVIPAAPPEKLIEWVQIADRLMLRRPVESFDSVSLGRFDADAFEVFRLRLRSAD